MYRSGSETRMPGSSPHPRVRPLWQQVSSLAGGEDDPFLWSIADVITLLLIFFILLYANSNMHDRPVASKSANVTAAPAAVQAADEHLKDEVTRFMSQRTDQGFTVRWDQTRPVFILSERITFAQGQAELLKDFQPTLQRIAAFIASQSGYQILVSGHSDDTPINTPAFPSNWELSAARAAAVVRFLCENGVDPRQVSIRGYGEYRPLYANTSSENRQANRRVEITLARES
ncbi:MAG: OmpA family protein [Syntrophaceae bacterium]